MNINFLGKTVTTEDLKTKKWLRYLCITKENLINPEKVTSIENADTNETLRYVEKTLQCPRINKIKKEKYRLCVERTLQWAEVSKCGSERDRKTWVEQGLNLAIHNEASAELYLAESEDSLWMTQVVYTLIKTHGLLGQFIRGEVLFSENLPLLTLITSGVIAKEHLNEILKVLNEAIVSAVSQKVWEDNKNQFYDLIDSLCNGNIKIKYSQKDRLNRLFPSVFGEEDLTNDEENLYNQIFPYHELWYPQVALGTFSRTEINQIFEMITETNRRKIKHISFYPLAKSLFYDYEGNKKVNIYKKRIIEFCLKELREKIEDKELHEHVKFSLEVKGDTLFVDVIFTKACESLIQFCIEAERSGIMDYQRNITVIFDLFGFRKDVFDRLNNEDNYLKTMNSITNSSKGELLYYVVGNSVVDVGSGGGVLLDLLEQRYPSKTIIGTDISTEVVNRLKAKRRQENHKYQVLRHNFVEEPLPTKVDTIIFSSILHEVYSYTDFEGRKFNIDSVKKALQNAYYSLNRGGRILIRDGILSDGDGIYGIELKEADGEVMLSNYLKDFKGLSHLRNGSEWNPEKVKKVGNTLTADINLIREFLYTYTWGKESYSCEVNEQFGYFTFDEYSEFLESIGLKIKYKNAYLEEGYPEHLNDLVTLKNGLKWEMMPSNCIFIAEK